MQKIEITNTAIDKLKEINVGGDNYLRLNIIPGGCSGMTYEAALDSVVLASDVVLYNHDGIKVITDLISSHYLEGLEIDYSDDLVQSGFRFINKNAVKSCACGSSFACQ